MTTPPRVLVVEDESVVALFMEDLLAELGYQVAGIVARLDDAMARAGDGTFDVAILDVHLQGEDVFPFAERLTEVGTPFVFATGYGERGILEGFRDVPTLQKPFTPDELGKVIADLCARRPK